MLKCLGYCFCFICFRDDYVALGSDDGADGHYRLLIWDLKTLTMIHAFQCHLAGIFQIKTNGECLVTRDKEGNIVFWNAEFAADAEYLDTEDDKVLMRKLELPSKDKFLCFDLDRRRLVVGKIGGALLLDFWIAWPVLITAQYDKVQDGV